MRELTESDYFIKGENVFLPNSDPAADVIKGYRRFIVGQDIAQAKDKNAIAVILDERLPIWTDRGQALGKRRREIVRVEYIPQMSYVDLARVTKNLMASEQLAGRSYLGVDASGVGRAYSDILLSKNIKHTRVTITSGENERQVKERSVTFNNVGKNRLLNGLSSAIHTGDLTLGAFELRDTLQQELETFEASVTAAGNMKIEGGSTDHHADASIAAAIAYWLSDHPSTGAFVGEIQLKGFY